MPLITARAVAAQFIAHSAAVRSLKLRDKSRRYGLCDWIMQKSLPCNAADNRTDGSGAIHCAMTFIKANIFIFTPVRMNAHPSVLCNLATDAHEYA